MDKNKISRYQEKLSLVVGKIAGNKFLLSLRDTFIMIAAPLMLAGFAIMINSVFLDPSGIIFGENGLRLGILKYGSVEAWKASGFAQSLTGLQTYFDYFVKGTMSINTVLVVVAFAFFLTRRFFPKNREAIISCLYALVAFFICLPWQVKTMVDNKEVVVKGILNSDFLGQKGIFAGLIIAGVTVFIYNKLLQKNIMIKMPDSVPPAVAKSFESMIPGLIAISIFVVLAGLSNQLFGMSIPEVLLSTLQKPAMAVAGTAAFAVAAIVTQPLLQWFGIHGSSVWGPIFGVTWNIADNENIMGVAKHVYSTLFMNFSVVASGALTIAPLIAIILFSKRKESKTFVKIAAAPALFNVSEPITFGLPIALNPIYFIPYVGSWPLAFFFAKLLTDIGFIPVITHNVPWTVPPVISGLLYSGSWTGAVAQIAIIALVVALWAPFVKIANKIDVNKDKSEA